MDKFVEFSDLTGLKIDSICGLEVGSDHVRFDTSGGVFIMYHSQDCCESVAIEDIVGDVEDLVDAVVIFANEDGNEDGEELENEESYTWTFYNIQTNKGHVQIRWLGRSNGYYSESVSFVREV